MGGTETALRGRPLGDLVAAADLQRIEANRRLSASRNPALGQHLTPPSVARLMASMFGDPPDIVRLLDPGAGTGSLTAAAVASLLTRARPPREIQAVVYEIDHDLIPLLRRTLVLCEEACGKVAVGFTYRVVDQDFIEHATSILAGQLFANHDFLPYSAAILNPPYKKINTASKTRADLRSIGLEAANLYAGFVGCAARLLRPGGQLVAITPRSFCNGLYFRPFRQFFLAEMSFERVHLFDSRKVAFREDQVLQENIVFSAIRSRVPNATVIVEESAGPDEGVTTSREVSHTDLVRPDDPESFIHIVADELGSDLAREMSEFGVPLRELGIQVSTGRVVDFRARDLLRQEPQADTAPLLYPLNLVAGSVEWPRRTSKAQAIAASAIDLLVPNANYVLVKRFSAKEERRRVVASVYLQANSACSAVGFENHLNYYHANGRGLDVDVAFGLAGYLNSSAVDAYFRQFSGHTQVNATDLRSLRYPTRNQLAELGRQISGKALSQSALDLVIEEELFDMNGTSPARAQRRIQEALAALQALGFPRGQQNERSALTLLALLDLEPSTPWTEASQPLRGITPMMKFIEDHYGKKYAPNTRETVRRQTVHQFRDAGLILINPDAPERPTNSGKTVYQVEGSALDVLRSFGAGEWPTKLSAYLASRDTLAKRYAQAREMKRIPVTVDGKTLTLSPGGQNVLVKAVVDQFAPRWVPGGRILYLGDTGAKLAHVDEERLAALGVRVEGHGKMPDLVLHHVKEHWLVLVEVVTSHGPVSPKRHAELQQVFSGATCGLVFVTVFADRGALAKYIREISWATEVWTVDAPDHLIHFDGERFLGPYQQRTE